MANNKAMSVLIKTSALLTNTSLCIDMALEHEISRYPLVSKDKAHYDRTAVKNLVCLLKKADIFTKA